MKKEVPPYVDSDFFKAVECLAKKKNQKVFTNSGQENALSVLVNLFRFTNKEISLFCQNERPDVSDDWYYAETLEKYLAEGKKLNLVVSNTINPDSAYNFYKIAYKYSQDFPKQVKIKTADSSFIQTVTDYFDGHYYNFAISDESGIRIEIDPQNFKAVCSFNEKKHSKCLSIIIKTYLSND